MWSGRFVVSSRRVDTLGIVSAFLMLAAVLAVAFMVSLWHAVSPQSKVPFLGNIRMAVEKARKEGKPILLDVHSDDNVWCVRMNREVYSHSDVAEMLGREFVPLQLTPGTSRRSRDFCRKYGFKAYPMVLVLDTKGNELARVTEYLPADEFLETLMEARVRAAMSQAPPPQSPGPNP
jgi:thioredoxin-related protein